MQSAEDVRSDNLPVGSRPAHCRIARRALAKRSMRTPMINNCLAAGQQQEGKGGRSASRRVAGSPAAGWNQTAIGLGITRWAVFCIPTLIVV
jgi:hypothetical protein